MEIIIWIWSFLTRNTGVERYAIPSCTHIKLVGVHPAHRCSILWRVSTTAFSILLAVPSSSSVCKCNKSWLSTCDGSWWYLAIPGSLCRDVPIRFASRLPITAFFKPHVWDPYSSSWRNQSLHCRSCWFIALLIFPFPLPFFLII